MKYIKTFENINTINRVFVMDFIINFGMFITMNLSQVTKMGIDENATKELTDMMRNLRKPIINGKNYSEVLNNPNGVADILKNPKLTSALFTQIKGLIDYIEPRIERFVDTSSTRDIWLGKINKFRKDYIDIINFYK